MRSGFSSTQLTRNRSRFPSITHSRLAQLGRELFFSKSLSGNQDVACASCHDPRLGGADGLSLPVGVGAISPDIVGPGRRHDGNYHIDPEADGGPNVERNSPTTFNIAFYDRALFYDGRVEAIEQYFGMYRPTQQPAPNGQDEIIRTPDSPFGGQDPESGANLTEAQARFPVVALNEMRGFSVSMVGEHGEVRDYLERRLQGKTGELKDNAWPALFRWAFDQPDAPVESIINYKNIAKALAEYQRSKVFIDSPWRRWLSGEGDLSQAAKRGAALFYTPLQEGGAQCYQCHSGEFFTDERYYNLAMPQFGPGKTIYNRDLGRYGATRQVHDMYAFRTPSLLNVSETAPYGHTGAFLTLEGIIRHHLNPEKSLREYDFSLQKLPQFRGLSVTYPDAKANTYAALQHQKTYGDYLSEPDRLAARALSGESIGYLAAFLETLTDPCITDSDCLQPWLPQGEAPDNNRLNARIPGQFNNDNPLPPITANANDDAGVLPDIGDVPTWQVECEVTVADGHQPGFTDVTQAAGLITHREISVQAQKGGVIHNYGATITKLIMNGGVAAGDINGDCLVDLIVDQGDRKAAAVMINQGKGFYQQPEHNWGLSDAHDLTGAVLVDLNGDGWLDLFAGSMDAESPTVFLNNGRGRFLPVSRAGFRVGRSTVGAGFGDVDGDGDLDAWLAHWDVTVGAEEEHLWRNDGRGLFSGIARDYGVNGQIGERDFVFTPNFADFNNDRLPDLALASDFLTSQYFINQSGKRLDNQTDKTVISDENGMGAAIADFDNDGDLDWFVTSIYVPEGKGESAEGGLGWGFKGNRLYLNEGEKDGRLVFNDVTEIAGVADGGWGWGSCAADFNNDGWLDIFHANGFYIDLRETRPDLLYLLELLNVDDFEVDDRYSTFEAFSSSLTVSLSEQQRTDLEAFYYLSLFRKAFLGKAGGFREQRSRLFINQQDGTFRDVALEYGITDQRQGRGVSCLDYDRDGDIDLLVANNTGSAVLYRNNVHGQDSDITHFLTVKLLGHAPNRHGIGARIYLYSAAGQQMREVRVENNYMSQNPLESHFGLGSDEIVKRLRIVWPDGTEQVLEDVPADQILVIRQQ
ncbi:hypothetical protein GCM10023116_49760 [Kistimonas scapharcae]|uniref:Cytochrome c domain-containing protein n=2 Tax=Kistimonas scapharcae TaxID=1036133 RepID=A0ABP8V9X9_9GAMM